MISLNKQINIKWKSGKIVFLLILIIFHLPIISGVDTSLNTQEEETQDFLPEFTSNDVKTKLVNNDNFVGNYSFNITSLFNYVDSLYEKEGIFLETIEGYDTSIATYEALSILRFLGLDYYKFGADWKNIEITIANKLRIDLKDKSGSGGFFLSSAASIPSLDGSFGVVNSLWIMNELAPHLKPIVADLLDFVYNTTLDKENIGFHEINQEISIKATFQALSILDLIRKTVIQVPPDSQGINKTVLEIMANYSVDLLKFINSKWVYNSHFDSRSPYRTPIEDTWQALQSINILERYGKLLSIPLPNSTNDYYIPVINWLKSLIKTTESTKGGFGTLDFATVTETGMSYAILSLFNATEEINSTETAEAISFVYSSQFLKRENRTYRGSEKIHLGGFGPNNRTYSNALLSKRVNIHDTYFAVLTLLLSGDIFNSTELSLETSHYKDYPNINKTNLIVQGKPATIEQFFTIYDYKSHGSLELNTTVDNWQLTHTDYTENNSEFYGKSDALYVVNLQNDSQADFNWSLGPHWINNKISIRNLPVIRSPSYYLNSTLFVGYSNHVDFNQTVIKPGDNVTLTITYQNGSVLTYSTQNITDGSVSAYLRSPNGQNETWFDLEPINTAIGAIEYMWNVSKQDLLGSWELTLTFYQSGFKFVSIIPIEVTDTVFFYNIAKTPQYYPGENMNLNISLKYSNGYFTPNANASVVFTSNKTQEEVFNLTLEHLEGNIYTASRSKCPNRQLYGFYNVSIRLTWNTSIGLQADSVLNKSLSVINIKGIPTISEASFETNYRSDSTLVESNLLYYGETINLTLMIGFKSSSRINNGTDEKVVVKGGLVNNTQPSSFIQLFHVSQHNKTLSLSGSINPNLPNATFGTRFLIQSEWNNSFVYLRNPINSTKDATYNFSLTGKFVITDVNYIAATEKYGDPHCYALDTTSVISISFKVSNSELENIPVPNINLYGILDVKNEVGTLNLSLPSITSAVDQNGTSIYLLSIPTSGLSPNDYEISIYTWTAVKNHLKIGQLSSGFKITTTFSPPQIIQPHEALILFAGIVFVILAYLNLRKFR